MYRAKIIQKGKYSYQTHERSPKENEYEKILHSFFPFLFCLKRLLFTDY